MYRKFVNFLHKESIPSTKEDAHVESQTAEQIEALRDLYSTYVHPVKCSYQTNSKKLAEKNNLISVLRQREIGLINFHRYPDARHRLMNRYFDYKF